MVWNSEKPKLTDKQSSILTEIVNSRTSRSDHKQRAAIILSSGSGLSDRKVAAKLHISRNTASVWRKRWINNAEQLCLLDIQESGIDYERGVLSILSDALRPGTPCKFTPEEICQIINVACEQPEACGLPFSHWSLSSLADEVVKRKIVSSISKSQLAIFLK